MTVRVLLPISLVALLGLVALWVLLVRGAPGGAELVADAPGGAAAPTGTSAPLFEPLEAPTAPTPSANPEGPGGVDPPADPGAREERRPLGASILEEGPTPPEPGEYEGPLVLVTFDDGTPCLEALQILDPSGTWVLHGRWRSYHENGQLQEQGWYENHQESGDWQWWDENGERIAVGTFIDGKREGAWTFWYSDGVRQLDAHYSGGEGTGLWTLYFENGQKCAEGQYQDGEFSGHWTIWDEFGAVNPERSGYYEKGQKVSD